MTDGLETLTYVDPAHLERLHAGLASTAEREGVLDITFRTLDTPVGLLLLAATARGVMRVAFESEGHDRVLADLADRVSPRVLSSSSRVDAAAHQLDEYFEGSRRAFELPLDFRLAHGFRLSVLKHLVHIGYGTTESYTEVAAATGHPKAMRAVGSACATNPLPVIVPCHRVLRSDGTLGGYLGGLDAKRELLAREALA